MTFHNQVTLQGLVGERAKVKTASNQTPYARLSLRTKEISNLTRSGDAQTRTCWHHLVAWGKLAYFVSKLVPGAAVRVEGELRTRPYTLRGSSAGTEKTPWITEVVIRKITLVESSVTAGAVAECSSGERPWALAANFLDSLGAEGVSNLPGAPIAGLVKRGA